jgi:hypothetical protein
MNSTACLVGSDAPHIELPFHFLPVGQRDVEEDNPITCHRKLEARLVAPWVCFFRIREPRAHARMRHVSLNRNVRAGNWLGGGICQPESEPGGADPCRFWRDIVINRDKS